MNKKDGVLAKLLDELKDNPQAAIELLKAMTNIVRPWEALKSDGQSISNSYRRFTTMGEEVALIESSAPTWILNVLGERFVGDKVFNRRGAEEEAQALIDAELSKRGYILMDSKAK